jgi:transcriptional regulator with XRE-family HTH domain
MANNKENSVVPASKSGSGSGSGLKASSRNQIFAKKLKERRELFGFTQVELAEKIGSNKGTIQNYESGSLPKGDYVITLAEVLECSLDWLLMDKGLKPEPPDKEKQVGETEPLYNKVETPGVGDRMVEYNADVDEFGRAVAGLKEIFDSRDPVLIPAIQANIHAFQISVRRERHIQRQSDKTTRLEKENVSIKARLEAIEKRLPPANENTEKKVM